MYTPCSKKKKEYTWEIWLIQSTECIILMYIPHRIPDHVCITANELLLTLPIDLQQTSELLLEHNQQEGKSCRCVSFWFVFAMSTILMTDDLLQQRWSILLFIHKESLCLWRQFVMRNQYAPDTTGCKSKKQAGKSWGEEMKERTWERFERGVMHQVYCSTWASWTLLIIFSELLKVSNFLFFCRNTFSEGN
jgi:hypothetical protein